MPTYRQCLDPKFAMEVRTGTSERVRLVLLSDLLVLAYPVGRTLVIPFEVCR